MASRARAEEGPPDQARISLTFPAEFRRKLVTYCKWHGVTPSDLIRSRLEGLLEGLVVRSPESPPTRVAAEEAG